jgi:hypothetical protein
VDPDMEKETLAGISKRFHDQLLEIKSEGDLIKGKLNNVQGDKYKKSETLITQLSKQVKTIEDRLKQKDKIIHALAEKEERSQKPRKY